MYHGPAGRLVCGVDGSAARAGHQVDDDAAACAGLVAHRWGCGQRVVVVAGGDLPPGPGPVGLGPLAALLEAAGHHVDVVGRLPELADVDQVWLLGEDPLPATDAARVATFMGCGGGVLATGPSGAALPRVRWWPSRHRAPGTAALRAEPVARGAAAVAGTSWQPHPVVRVLDGALDRCPAPPVDGWGPPVPSGAEVVLDGTTFEEWPERPSGGRPGAVVVATRADDGTAAMAAYDGDEVGVGRLVVVGSWTELATSSLDHVARWLAPRQRRWCLPWSRLARLRFAAGLAERAVGPTDLEALVALGGEVEAHLDAEHGAGAAEEVVADLLVATGAPAALQRLFLLDDPHETRPAAPVLVPRSLLGRAVLGGVLRELLAALPLDPVALAGLAEQDHHELAAPTTLDGVRVAEAALAGWLLEALEATDKVLAELGR